ncbi:MAG: ABC transporter ATP-binding protein [Candidatus Hydrogenedentota bacterium]
MTENKPPIIEIKDLHVAFKTPLGRSVTAVDGLDLSVKQGEVVGFIGPNGAGKTTTIKVLMGFIKPDEGDVRVFGEAAGSTEARRRIGYLPEVAVYYPFLTAREALRLYAKLAGIPRDGREQVITELIQKVGLAGRDRERLSGYSKGMLQRVGIAQAIMGDPEALILDEVTSGLDPVARHDVRAILMDFKTQGKTVFFSSHELTEVTLLCDRIILLDEGNVIEENELAHLLASSKSVVIRVQQDGSPATVPDSIIVRTAGATEQAYAADSWESAEAFRNQLEAEGANILDVKEEPPSLEDYFVRKLGHKTT